jgi:hypothetical protein
MAHLTDAPCVYLTNEQLHRLAGLACDALVGLQLRTTANDNDGVLVDMVPVDNPTNSRHYYVAADGSYKETT